MRHQDEIVAEALHRLENISSSINNREQEDEFHFFGLNVASQLRQIPLYEALEVQSEIQKLLTLARRRNMYPNLSGAVHSIPFIPHTQTNTPSAPNTQYPTPIALTQTNTPPNTQSFTYSTSIPQSHTNTFSDPNTNSSAILHTETNTPSALNSQTVDLLSEAWKLS